MNTGPDPLIPFGKYRGKRCGEVADFKYLDWMLGLDNLREPFKSQLFEHLKRRQDWLRYDGEEK